MTKAIGQLVREIRGQRTLKQMGELLQIAPSVISEIENGTREPSKNVAKKLSLFSGLPLEKFIK